MKQITKIGVEGNLINQIMGNNSTLPVVGKGATIMHYSDRTCAEVVEVSKDGKRVLIENYNTTADVPEGKTLPMGHQSWKHELSGRRYWIVWRNNAWRIEGTEVHLINDHTARTLTQEQKDAVYGVEGDVWPQHEVEGLSKKRKVYPKISILFGVLDYRYDWEF